MLVLHFGWVTMDYSNCIIIAVEGIDGAGKSTLIAELTKQLMNDVSVYERTKKGKITQKLVTSKILQKYKLMQIPVYLLLSYKNFCLFKVKEKKAPIVIMDRCFLSNICYFFPKALYDQKLLKRVLYWEVKLIPKKIFILDVDPRIGMIRDNKKKSLDWLTSSREAYLNSSNSLINEYVNIEILKQEFSTKQKAKVIIEYIQGEKDYGN